MAWLALAVVHAGRGQCPDNTVHWLQPNQPPGGIDVGILQANSAEKTWCYPTAAASLLGTLANRGALASGMQTADRYPAASSYDADGVWRDYLFHETDPLNLGRYMNTNIQNAGTTLADGAQGIEDFVAFVDPARVFYAMFGWYFLCVLAC